MLFGRGISFAVVVIQFVVGPEVEDGKMSPYTERFIKKKKGESFLRLGQA